MKHMKIENACWSLFVSYVALRWTEDLSRLSNRRLTTADVETAHLKSPTAVVSGGMYAGREPHCLCLFVCLFVLLRLTAASAAWTCWRSRRWRKCWRRRSWRKPDLLSRGWDAVARPLIDESSAVNTLNGILNHGGGHLGDEFPFLSRSVFLPLQRWSDRWAAPAVSPPSFCLGPLCCKAHKSTAFAHRPKISLSHWDFFDWLIFFGGGVVGHFSKLGGVFLQLITHLNCRTSCWDIYLARKGFPIENVTAYQRSK